MIRWNVVVLALASVVLAAAPLAAQPKGGPPMGAGMGGPGVGGPGPGRPPFMDDLYRPEMIMRNQGALAITPEQKTAMAAAIRAAQDRLGTLQWDLDAKSEALTRQVEGDRVDADAALATASQVIDLEGQVKKEHLKLLITIKNLLTPAQIVKLRELRKDRRGDGPGEGRGMRFRHQMGPKPPPGAGPGPGRAVLPGDPPPPPDAGPPDEPEP